MKSLVTILFIVGMLLIQGCAYLRGPEKPYNPYIYNMPAPITTHTYR